MLYKFYIHAYCVGNRDNWQAQDYWATSLQTARAMAKRELQRKYPDTRNVETRVSCITWLR